MDSNRIIINDYDQSQYSVPQTGTDVVGFTVIKAPKGSITPVRIPKGNTSMFQDVLGLANATTAYPEIYEAQVFNSEYDLYVSAPYTSAKVPVAYVTPYGVYCAESLVNFTSEVENYVNTGLWENFETGETVDIPGLNSFDANNKSNVLYEELTGPTSFGNYRVFNTTYTVSEFFNAINNGAKFKAGTNTLDANDCTSVSAQKFVVGYLSDDKFYAVDSSGTYNKDTTGAMTATGTTNEASLPSVITPSTSKVSILVKDSSATKIQEIHELPNKDIKAVIFPKYPIDESDSIHIDFINFNNTAGNTYNSGTVAGRNILKMSAYEDSAYHDASHKINIVGYLNPSKASEGFSPSNSSYADQQLIAVSVITPFTSADFDGGTPSTITSYGNIVLSGGKREFGSDAAALHDLGWEEAKSEEYSDVDIFFDSVRHDVDVINGAADLASTSSKFFTLAKNHPLAGYIFNCTVAPAVLKEEATNKLTTALDFGHNYWNICNELIVAVSSGKIQSPATGARALMQARIIDKALGGVAPMWTNSGSDSSLGGQLSGIVSAERLRFAYSKDDVSVLDELNFNPLIKDKSYGIMIVGQKTCKPGDLTDWSYIGHVSSFLKFKRDVRNNVMIEQIGKPNNDYYRELRYNQTMTELNKRISGTNRIWAAGIVDTSTAEGCNDAAARAALKFVINTKVKVNIYSEYVALNFTNVGQDVELA